MQTWRSSGFMIMMLTGFMLLVLVSTPRADESGKGAIVEGAGFTLYDMESIKGSDTEKLDKDPVCDRNKRPRIAKVEPDEAKPGDKVVISGENFGTKECFHTVTFSASPKAPVDYKFVNDTTIEATVPEAKAGMSFLIIVAGGGSAQSKPLLIKSK
ncbi:MAG: IPT/TIG domain-containing protein [Nitrospira sp.]|nr:IPT/TIG domain-containing protein [Nitrospira sp.]